VKDVRAERLPQALSGTEVKRKTVAEQREEVFECERRKEGDVKQVVVRFYMLGKWVETL
jgi:hypothetical protein